MKPYAKIIAASFGIFTLAVVGVILVFWFFDSAYPSERTVSTWEKNYRGNITNEISSFEGHWLDADIAAYIYSYKHTSSSIASHQALLLRSLKDFQVIDRNEKEMVLRRSVTYSRPDGFDEWHFLFDWDTKIVTVLFANLDSELWAHADLLKRQAEYHQKRKME